MKKVSKTLSLVALCVVMIVMSVIPAFAVTSDYMRVEEFNTLFVEDHNIIDCTDYFKSDSGIFVFTIRVPEGMPLTSAFIHITGDSNGTVVHSDTLNYFSEITSSYSHEGYDYYSFETLKYVGEGVGIKLFCEWNNNFYRATNTFNNDPEMGPGYWLSA